MSEFRVLIVDDEPERARSVGDMVERADTLDSFKVDLCANLEELQDLLAKGYQPQIVFMEISLADETPMDIFRGGADITHSLLSRYPGVQIICIADHDEYPSRIYRMEHVCCLYGSVGAQEVEEALFKSVENIRARTMRPFGVKAGGRIVRVDPSEIIYIESDRRKVRIVKEDEVIEAYESLGGIAAELPETFIQCHKSFLVNMEKVVEMRGNSLDLVSGVTIPVSQKRSRFAREAFLGYLRSRP